jgi:hypothetical protein
MTSKDIVAALNKGSEIELTVKGRSSGRAIPRPVWFVLSKDKRSIMLVPVHGKKTQWYLNVLRDPNVSVSIGDQSFNGRIREVGGEGLREVLSMFDAKYGKGDMERYYSMKDVAMEITLPFQPD